MIIDIFDPTLCCSSGVCGAAPDPVLVQVASLVEQLRREGATVRRHMLTQDPESFTREAAVYRLLLEKGNAALPVILVDGVVLCSGRYPTHEEILAAAGRG